MPTSYTSLLGLALPVTGELSGTWGDTVNNYITQYVDAAVAGAQTISGSQTAVTLSTTTNASLSQAGAGATGSAQYQIINCTGNPASALTVTVPSASKVYLVLNNTSTSQTVTVKGAATTGVTVAAARCALIAWNGTDFELVATDDASKMNGVLAAVNGGTGQSSYAVGDILYASTTTALSKLADVATGNALISGGVGVAPSYGKIGLTTHVSGTLPIANGGTNATATPTAGAIAYGTGSAYAFNTAGTSGQPLLSGGSGAPTFGTLSVGAGGTGQTSYTDGQLLIGNTTGNTLTKSTLTAGSGVTITNGNGSITISATGSGGTVTSVGATSPVASSGGNTPTISLSAAYGDTLNPYASKTANFFLAAPNGIAGVPSFRAIVAADVPTLNQNTTGTAANITASSNTSLTSLSSLATVGTITSGTWSASFGAVSGANLTNLTAGNLSGTIPSGVLGNSSLFVGTTSVALNRASANQALTGITSVTFPGSTSGSVQLIPAATAGTGTVLTMPATTGTVITSGDTGTVTNTMLAGSIANAKLANSTISGVALGSNLATLTLNTSGTGLSGSTTYNGSGAATFTVASNATNANTASTIVARDASGNFSAGTITATLSGNATNVTGTVAVANGGTGATSLTANNFLLGNGTSAVTASSLLQVSGSYVRPVAYADTVVAAGNTGTALTLTCTQGNVFTATLTGNATITLSSPIATGSTSITLILTNDATAGRTVAWAGGSFVFPGGAASLSRTTTANATDVWVFFTTNGGTTWYGNIAMKDMKA